MGSQKKPHQATDGAKPDTPPAPAKEDLGPQPHAGETYPSARFIHGAFHPRDVPDEPLHAEPGE